MTGQFYILDDAMNPVPATLMEWGEWVETANRHLGSTAMSGVWVSTVFLGIKFGNGPPVLWETMISSPDRICMDRYTSKEAALQGHEKALQIARKRSEALMRKKRRKVDFRITEAGIHNYWR